VAYAVSEIRRGVADVILAGGVDILSKFYYESLTKFRGLSPSDGGPEGARPFDVARNGYVAGEGCGILCLESLSHAQDRGARIYCEITGASGIIADNADRLAAGYGRHQTDVYKGVA